MAKKDKVPLTRPVKAGIFAVAFLAFVSLVVTGYAISAKKFVPLGFSASKSSASASAGFGGSAAASGSQAAGAPQSGTSAASPQGAPASGGSGSVSSVQSGGGAASASSPSESSASAPFCEPSSLGASAYPESADSSAHSTKSTASSAHATTASTPQPKPGAASATKQPDYRQLFLDACQEYSGRSCYNIRFQGCMRISSQCFNFSGSRAVNRSAHTDVFSYQDDYGKNFSLSFRNQKYAENGHTCSEQDFVSHWRCRAYELFPTSTLQQLKVDSATRCDDGATVITLETALTATDGFSVFLDRFRSTILYRETQPYRLIIQARLDAAGHLVRWNMSTNERMSGVTTPVETASNWQFE